MSDEKKIPFDSCETCGHFLKFEQELVRFETARKGEARYSGICKRKEDISLTRSNWGCPNHWTTES